MKTVNLTRHGQSNRFVGSAFGGMAARKMGNHMGCRYTLDGNFEIKFGILSALLPTIIFAMKMKN